MPYARKSDHKITLVHVCIHSASMYFIMQYLLSAMPDTVGESNGTDIDPTFNITFYLKKPRNTKFNLRVL